MKIFRILGIVLTTLLISCNPEEDKDLENTDIACMCNVHGNTTRVPLDSTNLSSYTDTTTLRHNSNSEANYQMMFIDETAFDINDGQISTEDLWIVLHSGQANKVPDSVLIYQIPKEINQSPNCKFNYYVVDVKMKTSSSQQSDMTHLIHIPVSETDWNMNDLFLLRIDGDDKKVIGTNTSKWPKDNNCK